MWQGIDDSAVSGCFHNLAKLVFSETMIVVGNSAEPVMNEVNFFKDCCG